MPGSLRSQDDPPGRLPDPAAPGCAAITMVTETAPDQRQQQRRPPCGSCNAQSGGRTVRAANHQPAQNGGSTRPALAEFCHGWFTSARTRTCSCTRSGGSPKWLIARQRELYAAGLPFAEKWRTAMRYLVGEDVSYEKIWLELQALAWNNADMRTRLARVNAERRAVLTKAFKEPRRELGIELPLEALVSLVMTFNLASSSSAWAASRPGTASSSALSTGGCRDDRTFPRADPSPLPR
jgi:hypothetical protein